jgi:hypothetical protein
MEHPEKTQKNRTLLCPLCFLLLYHIDMLSGTQYQAMSLEFSLPAVPTSSSRKADFSCCEADGKDLLRFLTRWRYQVDAVKNVGIVSKCDKLICRAHPCISCAPTYFKPAFVQVPATLHTSSVRCVGCLGLGRSAPRESRKVGLAHNH